MECKAVDANAMTAKLHVQATHLQTTLLRCGAPSDDLAGDKGLMASRAMRHQDSRREVACAVARIASTEQGSRRAQRGEVSLNGGTVDAVGYEMADEGDGAHGMGTCNKCYKGCNGRRIPVFDQVTAAVVVDTAGSKRATCSAAEAVSHAGAGTAGCHRPWRRPGHCMECRTAHGTKHD
ncbi:hypothetical protein PCL_06261 [Purpureocillium lilacinum]|uniref:Uncharacterized protein n=1 Tax=Purpureocillium lilacinum TaxID=33203 RepID=A0A2U3EM86_PURLI|nr:hypothetical protein PCL_06261 [Purpureocillium lilacinum]